MLILQMDQILLHVLNYLDRVRLIKGMYDSHVQVLLRLRRIAVSHAHLVDLIVVSLIDGNSSEHIVDKLDILGLDIYF